MSYLDDEITMKDGDMFMNTDTDESDEFSEDDMDMDDDLGLDDDGESDEDANEFGEDEEEN